MRSASICEFPLKDKRKDRREESGDGASPGRMFNRVGNAPRVQRLSDRMGCYGSGKSTFANSEATRGKSAKSSTAAVAAGEKDVVRRAAGSGPRLTPSDQIDSMNKDTLHSAGRRVGHVCTEDCPLDKLHNLWFWRSVVVCVEDQIAGHPHRQDAAR